MTSDEIVKIADVIGDLNPDMHQSTANLRATLEVAYQLALLNEQIGGVLNSRIPQIRVMVEPGEWPIQVNVQERR